LNINLNKNIRPLSPFTEEDKFKMDSNKNNLVNNNFKDLIKNLSNTKKKKQTNSNIKNIDLSKEAKPIDSI